MEEEKEEEEGEGEGRGSRRVSVFGHGVVRGLRRCVGGGECAQSGRSGMLVNTQMTTDNPDLWLFQMNHWRIKFVSSCPLMSVP